MISQEVDPLMIHDAWLCIELSAEEKEEFRNVFKMFKTNINGYSH